MLPFNLQKWIDDHKEQLKPPVGAALVFTSEEHMFAVMIVGGPNQRTDYHINQTEEFFYQLKGDMILKVIQNGEFKDIRINEGEVFLLAANTPHSPQRYVDTIGLVIRTKEKTRKQR